MRFHVLSLPHTIPNNAYSACAYTQKVIKFCKMMRARGHYIILYAHEDAECEYDELIPCMNDQIMGDTYGDHDWRREFFKFDMNDKAHQYFYQQAIAGIHKTKQPQDFLLAFWGYGHKPICDAHQDMIVVEPGIGYGSGHFARWRVYESYAVMHAVYGATAVTNCRQDWYHTVIPNYFDPEDFNVGLDKQDYCLFIGRIYEGKGIDVAVQATERAGKKLIVAGQGSFPFEKYPHAEYVGYADKQKRRILMSEAKMLIAPSMYIEPFGGVVVEAFFSGTPAITTDWGAFAETNINGQTGYRCRTMNDFVSAIHRLDKWTNEQRRRCVQWAQNYSLNNIARKYEKFFSDVLDVYNGDGWYQTKQDNLVVDNYRLLSYDK